MKKALAAIGCVIGLAASVAVGAGEAGAESAKDAVARGEYLVTIGGCGDCHTPWTMTETGPRPDESRLLSGHPSGMEVPAPPTLEGPWMWMGTGTMTAFAGPWGVTFSPNLTPHMTGLGVYTEEMFVQAMRTGKHMGAGRPIMPPMPWQNLAAMTDEDLKAMFAYLRSIPAIENVVPAYRTPEDRAER